MEDKIQTFIHKNKLLFDGENCLVALSGGADSVALLCILSSLGYKVEAAHCNFHLRGEESQRDEIFCRDVCSKYKIPLHLTHFDTKTYAESHKISIEMAARDLRYNYFQQLCNDLKIKYICVGHHKDDNVETLLLNLIRGTGLQGLTAMSPIRDNIIRPLLCVGREEIVEYLEKIGQNYITDSSNLINDVKRNKIRLNIIPQLQKLNPQIVESISKTISYLTEAKSIVDNATLQVEKTIISKTLINGIERIAINIRELLKQVSPKYFLFQIIKNYGFISSDVDEIISHLSPPKVGRLWYSFAYTLLIDRESLFIEKTQSADYLSHEMLVVGDGVYHYNDKFSFYFSQKEIDRDFEVSKEKDIVHLDLQKVIFPLKIRHIRKGDKFIPFGMTSNKLISDYLTDRHFSYFDKLHQLVVCDAEDNVLWLVEQRINNRIAITSETVNYLEIKKTRRLS